MKKAIILFCIFFIVIILNAQPKLVGCTSTGGANGDGSVIQYTGGSTVVGRYYCFPANGFGDGPAYINLTESTTGLLYGLNTNGGGPERMGTIFEYNYNTNSATVKVYMDSAQIGYGPNGCLLLASNGIMYGLNAWGDDSVFGGTLFSYIPGDTTLTTLVILPGAADPYGSVIEATNGKLYGLTCHDGTNTGGTIFQYDITSNTYTVAYNLPLAAHPYGRLLEVGADTLYGLTHEDGTNGSGTLFQYVINSNTYTVLHNLNSNAYPSSWLIRASNGDLYGMTYGDGANMAGTIFSYNIASSTYTDLYDFGANGTDASYPEGGLIQASDGNLYGTTPSGGANGDGTIFSYNIATATYTLELTLDPNLTGAIPGSGSLTEYFAPSGIASVNTNHFSLSPNPTTSSFTIQNNYPDALTVNIINLLGERLRTYSMTGTQQSFDISDLAAGIYEVQISDASQTLKVMKVVKE